MDFVLWASRVMHIVSVVVWLGGLIFLNAIVAPVVDHEKVKFGSLALALHRRFLPFVWFSIWTIGVTGILLMLLSPRFIWLDYSTDWSKLLVTKQVSFLLMIFFSWQIARVYPRLEESTGGDQEIQEGWRLALGKLVRRTLVAGLTGLICGAWMSVT